jgi:predicted PurR-regulated permease PerM
VTATERAETGSAPEGRLRRTLAWRRKRSEDEFERRFSAQLSKHFTQARAERRLEHVRAEPEIAPGESNFTRAQVPYGVDLAAAWSWRFLVIVAAGLVITRAMTYIDLVVLPVIIALFLSALMVPLVNAMSPTVGRGFSTLVVVLMLLGFVTLMVTFATQQVIQGATDLSTQVISGLDRIRDWLQNGPLQATDAQIDDAIQQAQDAVTASNAEIVRRITGVSTAVGQIVASFFLILFATYFFLADGRRIWTWVVRLFPRAARSRVDASGQVAWLSLTQFVRATVLVALVDAIGIMIVAAVLKLPFVMAIGVLVFLGSFVPLVGATVSGLVAILVALVAQGPIAALIMLAGVVGVQQLEAQVLQPFLLGRMVSIHPLAVLLAVASGVYLAGVTGALVAVPLVASLNAVIVYLAGAPPDGARTGPVLDEADTGPMLTEDEEPPTRP